MKVIGKTGRASYLCEIEHTELEKFLNQYYDHYEILTIGQKVDLGKGYDFHLAVKQLYESMAELCKDHDAVMKFSDVLYLKKMPTGGIKG